MKDMELTYDRVLGGLFSLANPIKKTIIKTKCEVHKFINVQSIEILKNDEYFKEKSFFNHYIEDINNGAVWTDQDFKSSNHFYDPSKKKGMYGRKSAMDVGVEYYNKALDLWREDQDSESLFYLGSALHIIQDMTVPQHINIRLLDNHRQYENYIKKTYRYMDTFRVDRGVHIMDRYEDYVEFNARVSKRIYKKHKNIKDSDERYYSFAKCGLPLAERTTAGAMILFYKEIHEI
ncbi:zinc dependent phospholipase C family protein [Tissierella creatinophila]|uniref:Phospholipase C n=1 Tax=Tissierella creatinophila DSM 6911 TaxID=1123403 RepID=A0A1U7M8K4_TISCR|nr:zinc dependent phospholipase C family protein [Tissierella creatinophila]OLS03580.1 zinc dependent phospholipase C [Tissierella creatinophila DSM 6911]